MRLEKVQEALKTKKIHYEYTEENGTLCLWRFEI